MNTVNFRKVVAQMIRARRADPNKDFIFGDEGECRALLLRGVVGPRGRLP